MVPAAGGDVSSSSVGDLRRHGVEVVAAPEEEELTHVQVVGDKEKCSTRRLLADLARWTVTPLAFNLGLKSVRGAWDATRVAAIAVGGVMGAALRWSVVTAFDQGGLPWPVLLVNAAGSLLLGVLLAEEWFHPRARLLLHDVGGIGFCGGLTTFSTFSLEVVNLARSGQMSTAVLYALVSVTSAIFAVILGAAALRRVRALTLPLEEMP